MLDLLEAALRELPALAAEPSVWRGLRIDYHAPFVDRAWRPWRDGYRLAIHVIHPCDADVPVLLHPHPWPSAMAILEGRYAMALGRGPGLAQPPIAARVVCAPGTRYAMTDRDAWHDVRPLDGAPVVSVMLSGPPWDREVPVEPAAPLAPLDPHPIVARAIRAR